MLLISDFAVTISTVFGERPPKHPVRSPFMVAAPVTLRGTRRGFPLQVIIKFRAGRAQAPSYGPTLLSPAAEQVEPTVTLQTLRG